MKRSTWRALAAGVVERPQRRAVNAQPSRPAPRKFCVAGDVLDFAGIVYAYESASGKKKRSCSTPRSATRKRPSSA
jgi:hypothetical protein